MASCVYAITVTVAQCSVPTDRYDEGQLLVDIRATNGERYIDVPSERQLVAGELVEVEANDHEC